ncbi:MAG: hypothetical protein ACI9T7_000336 [Oleiphilaceae bacterium]|jgi:hypothetical protein
MLGLDIEYPKKFDRGIIVMINNLDQSDLTSGVKENVKNNLLAYQVNFNELVKIIK